MKTTKHTLSLLSTAIAAALLASCGGGGGSGTASGGSGGGTGGTSTIVTSVPAATYAAGSQEKAAYDYLNAERAKCGFGLLAQNAKLDQAAAAHANYIVANNAYGHGETVGLPGFTGATPAARAAAAGYSAWYVGENYADDNTGLGAIKQLMVAPYHLNNLVYGDWDVGVAYKAKPPYGPLVIDLAVPSNIAQPQKPIAGTVLTYPCAGSSVVNKSFTEIENWTGGAAGAGFGGTPVSIQAPNGEALSISSASYTPIGGGAAVPVSVLTAANDPNKILLPHNVLIIPPASLAANTTYRVQIAGTAAGVPFTKDFTFTTGN